MDAFSHRHILGLCALGILGSPQAVLAHPGYVGLIPNGAKVPGERKPLAVGHVNPFGHGERNQFGLDFHAAGKKWTKDLCNKDSDGDGLTNGQELGDPDCVWKKGKTPSRTTDITHPGIAKPAEKPASETGSGGLWSSLSSMFGGGRSSSGDL
mmetsp:Transcript_87595/g.152933  ORF Transcript_87595/g.152933 Transcript_87595/m.152933 type:complete len:153 (+) Transcript_87595:3-461(+)